MEPIVLVIYSVVLAATYLLAGHMAYGPETLLQTGPEASLVGKLGKTSNKKFLVLQIFLLIFVLTTLLYLIVILQKNFNSFFDKLSHVMVAVAVFFVVGYALQRMGEFKNYLASLIAKLVLSGIIIAILEYYSNWITLNISSLLLALILLTGFRNLKVKQFLIFGIGVLLYDAIAVFLSKQMIAAFEQSRYSPGILVIPTSTAMTKAIGMGLGDIVIPGILIMIAYNQSKKLNTKAIWIGAFAGYVISSVIASMVLLYTNAAQPATIYLIPGVTAGYFLAVWYRGLAWEDISTV